MFVSELKGLQLQVAGSGPFECEMLSGSGNQGLFQLLHYSLHAAMITTGEGRIFASNGTAAELIGWENPEELIGLSIGETGIRADQNQKELVIQALQSGNIQDLEFCFVNKKGCVKTVLLSVNRLVLDGKLCLLGVAVDITARENNARVAQRHLQETYQLLVENSLQGLSIVQDGRFVFCNETLTKMLGYSVEELLALSMEEVNSMIHEEDRAGLWSRYRDQIAGKAPKTAYEFRGIKKDGTEIWLEMRLSLVEYNGKPAVQLACMDISERKKLQEQLQHATKMEAIGVLAGGVAHDFNNLISVIKGYTELLLNDLEPGNLMREDLEQIASASQRAASLASQLLAFSSKHILQPEELDLNAAVSELQTMLRRLIGEDIELMFQPQTGLGRISADPGQIQQIVLNLAVNARKAMPEGGRLTIETANVELDGSYISRRPLVPAGSYVMLAISDTGIGMDAFAKSHIFEPFSASKDKSRPSGLGLSTVYGIVRQSNGFIWVYSEPNEGTTFKIYFPQIPAGNRRSAAEPENASELMGHETILIAEDEDSVRALAGRILRERGYTVLEACDALEAIRTADEFAGSIDLILTDVVMPGMGGRKLVSQLERARPGIKSLYISGYTDSAIVHHGLLDSDIAFLQKPFTVEGLARKVRQALNR